jgi:hypothetical protein
MPCDAVASAKFPRVFSGPSTSAEQNSLRDEVNPLGDRSHLQQLQFASEFGDIYETFSSFAAQELEIPSSGDRIALHNKIISIGNVKEAHKIMQANPPKHPFYHTFGRGVFVETDPTEWQRQRKWLSPGFGMGELAAMVSVMEEEIDYTAAKFEHEWAQWKASDSPASRVEVVKGAKQKFAQMTLSIIARVGGGVGSE